MVFYWLTQRHYYVSLAKLLFWNSYLIAFTYNQFCLKRDTFPSSLKKMVVQYLSWTVPQDYCTSTQWNLIFKDLSPVFSNNLQSTCLPWWLHSLVNTPVGRSTEKDIQNCKRQKCDLGQGPTKCIFLSVVFVESLAAGVRKSQILNRSSTWRSAKTCTSQGGVRRQSLLVDCHCCESLREFCLSYAFSCHASMPSVPCAWPLVPPLRHLRSGQIQNHTSI